MGKESILQHFRRRFRDFGSPLRQAQEKMFNFAETRTPSDNTDGFLPYLPYVQFDSPRTRVSRKHPSEVSEHKRNPRSKDQKCRFGVIRCLF